MATGVSGSASECRITRKDHRHRRIQGADRIAERDVDQSQQEPGTVHPDHCRTNRFRHREDLQRRLQSRPSLESYRVITAQKPAIPAGTIATLANHVSGPVAIAAAVVVGVALVLILAVWLAKKILHKVIAVVISAVTAGAAHEGTQTWIHHLISTNLHT
jgi:hypothetical protein